jgi:hypothetical protein
MVNIDNSTTCQNCKEDKSYKVFDYLTNDAFDWCVALVHRDLFVFRNTRVGLFCLVTMLFSSHHVNDLMCVQRILI